MAIGSHKGRGNWIPYSLCQKSGVLKRSCRKSTTVRLSIHWCVMYLMLLVSLLHLLFRYLGRPCDSLPIGW
ncbi:hypothetical protein OG21DRAFT_337665 [Imleria badia]|nr:hypothetical protein OG21DRAFT_337665 [Imleria badia]